MFTQEKLVNGSMELEVCLTFSKRIDKYDLAMVHRLGDDSYIVVRGLRIYDEGKCDWDYALQYDLTQTEATELFYETVND